MKTRIWFSWKWLFLWKIKWIHEFVKIQEYALVIILVISPQKCQFNLENEKFWNFGKFSLTHIGKSRKLFPKNGRWLRGYPGYHIRDIRDIISRKIFPGVFQILQFWGVTQGIFRKLFPGKFHEYLPMKKIFFPKNGAWLRGFSGNFFQANFLCTYSRKSINKYLLMTSWTLLPVFWLINYEW